MGIYFPGFGMVRALRQENLPEARPEFSSLEIADLWSVYNEIPRADFLRLPIKSSEDRYLILPGVLAIDGIAGSDLSESVLVKRSSETFQLSDELSAFTEPHLASFLQAAGEYDERKPVNDLNLRIAGLRERGASRELILQPVEYFSHIRTNLTMDFRPEGRPETLRQRVHRDMQIEPLGETSLADHIGVDCLVFTEDGYLIVARRAERLHGTAGGLGPTSAGALRADDFLTEEAPRRLGELRMLRELREEFGLTEEDLLGGGVLVLGIVRDLLRGGKPQLLLQIMTKRQSGYFTSQRWRRRAETKCETVKFERVHIGAGVCREVMTEDELHSIRTAIATLVETRLQEMTEPLQMALAVWYQSRVAAVG